MQAVEEFDRALALNPNFALAHTFRSVALAYLGRTEEALVAMETGARLGPRELVAGAYNVMRAGCCFIDGRYRDGIGFARKAVQEAPTAITSHRILIANLAQAGEIAEAKSAVTALRQLKPDITLAQITETVGYDREDDRRRWREAFRIAGLE